MTNYSFALWMLLAVGLLLLLVYVALANVRRKHLSEIDLSDIVPYLLPVDVQAFAETISVTKDAYLQHSQSRQEFEKLQRKRLRLAAEYLRRMNHNAALLQRIGYRQLGSSNPMIAEQAQELIDAGVRVRLFVFFGSVALLVRRVWGLRALSQARISEVQRLMSSNLIPAYQVLRVKAGEMISLRDSTFREALVQAL
jgi:hypothetical protein